jgi:hypothetical protein
MLGTRTAGARFSCHVPSDVLRLSNFPPSVVGTSLTIIFQGRAERVARRLTRDPARGSAPWRARYRRTRSAGGRDAPAGHSFTSGLVTSGLAASPLHLRHAAGCRPSVNPALPVTCWLPSRQPIAPRGNGHPPGAPVLSRSGGRPGLTTGHARRLSQCGSHPPRSACTGGIRLQIINYMERRHTWFRSGSRLTRV